ncbi:sulfatase family protein [Pedobacter sp. MW01-1-1]|uniref:sulfatase family protein n=1 Tax=Pedobacter sp. MW01-1-1 TaxID=3383027 RepID=UPI003FF0B3F4
MRLLTVPVSKMITFGLLLGGVFHIPIAAKAQKKPNIIVFFTDDQGYADLGCYGATNFKTPNIDKLAANGMLFKQFYVPASVCTPSRAGLLTGKYPKRTNLDKEVIYSYSKHGLAPGVATIPTLLHSQGYISACIGKWHLGNQLEFMPNNHGFDYFYGVPYSNDMDGYYYANVKYQSPPLPVYLNQKVVRSGVNQDSLTAMWTNAAVKFIHENKKKPFFMYLAHNMPHAPWHASDNFKDKSGYGLYGDAMQELDWSMGELIKTLKDEGLSENTIIIFTSDNGPVTTLKNGGSAQPLKGGKTTTWEGGMRVPGIVYWPGKIPKGVVSNEPVSTLDLLPTLSKIAGVKTPSDLVLDGRDISQLWLKPKVYKSQPFELLYYGRNGDLEAYTNGKWKLHLAKSLGWDKTKGAFPVSLFNLQTDLSESTNVAEKEPNKVLELEKRMHDLDSQIIPLKSQKK